MGSSQIYVQKALTAAGEWVARGLMVNRCMPKSVGSFTDIRYAEDSRKQSVDVLIPYGEPPYPVLVFVHGGSFHFVDKKTYRRLCSVFASYGFLVINADYRLAPRYTFPSQFSDVGRSVRWAFDNARRFGGDPERIFIGGDSAGACLVAAYATANGNRKLMDALSIDEGVPRENLRGLLLFYGLYDFETVLDTGFSQIEPMARGFLGTDPQVYRERAEVASSIRHLDERFPPSLLVSGEEDMLHSETVAFQKALERIGVEHETVYIEKSWYPAGAHGFVMAFFLPSAKRATSSAVRFLKKHS
jgi:acetyl esterase/lipase